MSIVRWYEIVCDTCGNAIHFMGSIKIAERDARKQGYIITANKEHFCTQECYQERRQKNG